MENKENKKNNETYVFIDASNLFYGGEKSLGWKIDYEKLLVYLREKYNTDKVFYFDRELLKRYGNLQEVILGILNILSIYYR